MEMDPEVFFRIWFWRWQTRCQFHIY